MSSSPGVSGDRRPPVLIKDYECPAKTLTMHGAFYFAVLYTSVDHLSWLKRLMHNIF